MWVPFKKANLDLEKYLSENCKPNLSIKMTFLKFLKETYKAFAWSTGCFATCRYPDWHDLWARKACGLVKEKIWDVVISSGGPYSVHRIGLALKRVGRTRKWVVDWRDLWTKNHLFPGLFIFHPVEKHLEKLFHRSADMITTVSEPLAEILRATTNTRVEVVYNGYDPEDFEFLLRRPRKRNDRFHIVYTGTIYKNYQDPSPLFSAVGSLMNDGIISPADLRIIFAGPTQSDLSDLAVKYGIEEVFNYAGFLTREKALELQYDADVCLFLEYGSKEIKGILTGKLFEYLYNAKEIWAVGVSADSEAGKLIEKSKAGTVFGTDVEKIKDYLIQRLKLRRVFQDEKNYAFIRQFERKNQALRILELLS